MQYSERTLVLKHTLNDISSDSSQDDLYVCVCVCVCVCVFSIHTSLVAHQYGLVRVVWTICLSGEMETEIRAHL